MYMRERQQKAILCEHIRIYSAYALNCEFCMTLQESCDLLLIFLWLQAAGGIDQNASRIDQTRCRLQQVSLHASQMLTDGVNTVQINNK